MRESPFVKFFVERSVFSTALFLALVLFGILSARNLGVDLLPRFDVPVVAVTTAWPGSGPEEVQNQVSQPIEETLATLSGIDSIASLSGEGFSQVVVQFDYGRSVDQVAVDVAQRVAAVRGQLPSGAEAPVVQKFDPGAAAILFVAITSPGRDLREVETYADDVLKPQFQQVQGVADIRVQGGPRRQVDVRLNPERLANFGLSATQVVGALRAAALELPAGSQTLDGERLLYSLRTTPKSAAEVANLTVDPVRGLKVQDVALVLDSQAEPSSLTRLNGQPVVLLAIRKVPDANSVAVAAGIKQTLSQLSLPEGYQVSITGDSTRFIEATVDDTFKETLLVAGVVALIVLIALGKLNSVFSVVVAIPITMAGALVFYGLLGFTFNVISLLAIIVAVGIVVDDSIVVAENIDRYRNMGYGLKEAVLKGTTEVLSAVSAASLSLLAVFLPISFLPGFVGQFFREFGLGLAAAIAVSWAEALLFLTVRLAYLPDPNPPSWVQVRQRASGFSTDWRWALAQPPTKAPSWIRVLWWLLLPLKVLVAPISYVLGVLVRVLGAIALSLHQLSEAGLLRLREGYAKSLDRILPYSPWVMVGALLVLSSLAYVGPRIPFNFAPRTDNGIINADLQLAEGVALSETNRVVRRLEGYLLNQPAVADVLVTVGSSRSALTSNSERATLTITLKPKVEREDIFELTDRYREGLNELIEGLPGAELRVAAFEGGPGGSADIQLTLSAPSPERLEQANEAFVNLLRQNPALVNVTTSLEQTATERVFVPNPAKLAGTGLTASDIGQILRTFNAGTEAARVRSEGQEIPIVVRADPLRIVNQDDLLSLPIYAPQLRASLPLSALGSFEQRESPATLSRTDQAFSAGITANLAPGYAGVLGVLNQIESEATEKGILGNGVGIDTQGSAAFVGDLAATAPLAFGLALLLNFLVIASQFNSFRYPLYLLMPVPLALVGAFWLAYAFGTGLDTISVLGTVLLIGLVTKNAILLLDFAVQKSNGLPLRQALVEAARLRLRPIIMTTLTVLIISIPLIFGVGEGSEFRRPLGVIILGGVATSTILTLFVVPAAFYWFERRYYQAKLERERPAAATD